MPLARNPVWTKEITQDYLNSKAVDV